LRLTFPRFLVQTGVAFLLFLILVSQGLEAKALKSSSNFLKISLFPAEVKQGQSFTVFLESAAPLKSIKLTGLNRKLFVYRIWHEKHPHVFRGFVGVPVSQKKGTHKIVAEVIDQEGENLRVYTTVIVQGSKYKVQRVNLSKKKTSLLAIEKLTKEGNILGSRLKLRHKKVYFASHFIRPAKGRISSPFGVRRKYNGKKISSYHKGIDIANKTGTPVQASNGGKISLATDMKSNGKIILINHGHGITTIYSHLSVIKVKEGQWVKRGDLIGEIGSTGISSGSHLHFGFSVNNVRVDPDQWLRSRVALFYTIFD